MVDLPAHEVRRLRAVAWSEADFEDLVRRRRTGEPLQYLEGTVQFGPLELLADRRALIPRPETELLWEMAVQQVVSPRLIVDLCTGSGNLALALKHAFPETRVYATDVSEDALSLAEENGSRAGLEVDFLKGDLFEPLPPELRGRVDLLVANPPYVSEAEFAELPTEVRDHEPYQALVAGPGGDEVVRRIIEEAPGWLADHGQLFCEVSPTLSLPPGDFQIRPDLAGRPRVLVLGKA